MLKIVICDDDIHELTRISKCIGKYREERKFALKYQAFSNAFDLLESIRGGRYDILLLDILMPGINGIQVAREIRGIDNEIKIIFLTSTPEFAVDSYAVGAYYYLIKPGTEEKLFPILDKLFLDAQRTEDTVNVRSASGLMRIPLNRLEFFEVMGKKLLFHLTDGSIKETAGPLSEYEAQLVYSKDFVKVHRSYIVNLGCIQELRTTGLTTYSGLNIPISRLLYGQVKQAYMEHLFAAKAVR